MRWRWLGLVVLATLLLAADPSSALALSSSTGFEGRYSTDCVAEDVLAIHSQEAGRLPDRPAQCRGDSRVAEVRLRPGVDSSAPNPATMDSFTWNGSTVRHSPTATAIGDDLNTATNFRRSQGAAGHDVIVHGQVIDGQAQFMTNGLPTHPQQIADAVLSNPSYVPGSPVQLVTCHGACGIADELSGALGGAPVRAVPGRVDIDPVTGLLREWK